MKNIALVVMFAASVAFAQMNISTGSISGTVTDPSGQVIPGAIVTLTSELSGEVRTLTTTGSGDFSFLALVEGAYTVRASFKGFRQFEKKSNMVTAGARLAMGSLQLEVAQKYWDVVLAVDPPPHCEARQGKPLTEAAGSVTHGVSGTVINSTNIFGAGTTDSTNISASGSCGGNSATIVPQ